MCNGAALVDDVHPISSLPTASSADASAFLPEGRRSRSSIYTDSEMPPLTLATHDTTSWYDIYHT